MVQIGKYDYPGDVMDTAKISKNIHDEIKILFKEKKINKGKLLEEFYKKILIRFKDGSLNASSGYLTINIFTKPIIKD